MGQVASWQVARLTSEWAPQLTGRRAELRATHTESSKGKSKRRAETGTSGNFVRQSLVCRALSCHSVPSCLVSNLTQIQWLVFVPLPPLQRASQMAKYQC